jgi:spermidine dehydrogenase
MDRAISRRDFLNGVSAVAAGALVPGCAGPATRESTGAVADYPPECSGLRGSHAGSFEIAHELVIRGSEVWGSIHEPDSGIYDLVVVRLGATSYRGHDHERLPREVIGAMRRD